MFELKILTRFAAAHQLTMVGSKCENMHGHNWKIEVCVKGDTLDKGGVVLDFGILKKYVAEVIDTLDHKYLNELPAFANRAPSSENIGVYIVESLQEKIADLPVKISALHAWESDDSCATYIPD